MPIRGLVVFLTLFKNKCCLFPFCPCVGDGDGQRTSGKKLLPSSTLGFWGHPFTSNCHPSSQIYTARKSNAPSVISLLCTGSPAFSRLSAASVSAISAAPFFQFGSHYQTRLHTGCCLITHAFNLHRRPLFFPRIISRHYVHCLLLSLL